ncbi:hypothetical protein DU43_18400 [Methanosarcina mazei]|uniref:TIR domain-containing protein n=1 Tax=Methanosarcina mazei TaxID=2209 RepID=A0A0F8JM14_METMZ|nr:toll/interleukin-1 receptor domain-containing protein [Methanosarcina mazei]KKG69845.1 hypothetical protein DU43_18400 [Methanosarcina mazei]
MDIFISWSGDISKIVAEALKDFLETVLQATKPWVSSIDLASGDRWNEEISKKLSDSKYGIICLTKYNINAPWILFEAGALAKSVDKKTYVCPYLVDFDSSELKPPLSLFHARKADMEGTLQLIKDINFILEKNYHDSHLKDKTLEKLFKNMWPAFESTINNLPNIESEEVPKRDLEDMVKEILEITRSIDSPETKGVISLAKKVDEIEDNLSWIESDKDSLEGRVDDLEGLKGRVDDLEGLKGRVDDLEGLEGRVDSLEDRVPKTIGKDLKFLERKVEKIEDDLTVLEGRVEY